MRRIDEQLFQHQMESRTCPNSFFKAEDVSYISD